MDFEIFEDNLVESDESFTFVLSLPLNPPPGYSAGSSAIVTIQDDECEGFVQTFGGGYFMQLKGREPKWFKLEQSFDLLYVPLVLKHTLT